MRTSFSLSLLLALTACGPDPLPPGVTLTPEAPTTTDDLVLGLVANPENSERRVISYDVRWSVDGEAMSDLDDALTVPAALTTKGQVWQATVTAVDDKERIGESVTTEVTIINTAPTASVELAPTAPKTTEDLVATVTSTDADGDALTTTYTWLRGTDVEDVLGERVPADRTAKGETWTVRAVVNDGEADSEPVEAQVSIDNSVPVADSVVITPSEAYEDTELVASPAGADSDGDTLSWSYAWSINGVDLPGVDTATLTGDYFDKGDEVSVSATPNDGNIDGNTVTGGPVTILNTAPSVESAAIDPTAAAEDTELSCIGSGFTDIDGDAPDYRYSWQVNGAVVSTDATLDGNYFDRDDTVVCVITPWDGEAEGAPVSTAALVIDNTAPELTSVALSDLAPRTNDTLTATATGGFDLDGDAISYEWSWTVAGSVVATETTSTPTATLSGTGAFSKGETVFVTVTPKDDGLSGTPVSSSSATVANTLPTAPDVEITPAEPDEDDDLVCSVVVAAADADGDSLTYNVDWYLDGVLWTGSVDTTTHSGDTIAAADLDVGDEWECEVTADDGDGEGPAAMSDVVEIVASSLTPVVGATGTLGSFAPSGSRNDGWRICRVSGGTAWFASNSRGGYNFHDICKAYGYKGADAWGGTCGTVCGYCGTSGDERYSRTGTVGTVAGNLSATQIYYTVHWRCAN